MSKFIKEITLILIILLLVFKVCTGSVEGATTGLSHNVSTVSDSGVITNSVNKIWGTIRLVLQVVAISVFLYSGVRYMFSSADQKADIKKSMGILAIGAALVFGTTLILQFIIRVAGEVF